ncbi:MAG: PHP domain-containing protein, partial [Acidobacteriota bacterium]
TGSQEHVRLLTEWAVETGFRIDDDGLFRGTERISITTEEEIYQALRLRFIPPEIRQGGDEVRLARDGRLPALIASDDLRGTFHVHTVWSDGAATIEEMAAEAEELGFEYLGVSDHSRRASIANGLSPERLERQMEEIDRWNRQGNRIRILKGSEVDILEDGSLDFGDALLARLDFVIASIHERFGMDPQRMTDRLLRALDNPHLTILGHPTGRLLLEREPFGFDMDAVFRRAAERGVKVELNASPRRLDPEPEMCRRAAGLGARLSIDPDAHHLGGIADVRYGIDQARRGWLTRGDVWNCLPLKEILAIKREFRK